MPILLVLVLGLSVRVAQAVTTTSHSRDSGRSERVAIISFDAIHRKVAVYFDHFDGKFTHAQIDCQEILNQDQTSQIDNHQSMHDEHKNGTQGQHVYFAVNEARPIAVNHGLLTAQHFQTHA